MAIVADAGTFATGTGTGDLAAQTPSLGGATPQLILFGCSVVGGANSDMEFSFGAATGTAERASAGMAVQDGGATTNSGHILQADAALVTLDAGGGIGLDGVVDLAAVGADSFTPTIDDAFVGSETIGWLALAGFDNVKVGTFLADVDATGDDAVTGVGFRPDYLIFFGTGATLGAVGTHARFILGWSNVTTQRCVALVSRDNVADTSTYGYLSDDYCWALPSDTDGALNNAFTLKSLDADGFTVNRAAGTLNTNVGYIAIKGGSFEMIDTAFNATEVNETGTAFTPLAGLFFHRGPVTAFDTAGSLHMAGGFGWAVSATKRFSTWYAEESALAAGEPYAVQATDALAINYDKETGATQDGGQDFVSWDSNGYTMVADDAAAGNYKLISLVFGNAAAAAAAASNGSVRNTRRRRLNGRRKR